MPRRPAPASDRAATYRQVFSSREFPLILAGHTVSALGDQALRVALALLVYKHTGSPLATAFAYSLTFLPWVVAGPLLSGYVDRLPRRSVMVLGTLARCVIVGVMAIPAVPVPAVMVLVFLSELLAPPIDAAGFAVLPDVLTGDRYVVGSSIVQSVGQAAQLAGFTAGGALVAAVGAHGAFGLDALSFLLAAACYRWGVAKRYEPDGAEDKASFWADTVAGFRISLGSPGPRGLVLLAWWGATVLLVPEALAAPYVARVAHEGDAATGWLLAALPAGSVIGALALARLVRPSLRLRLMHPMAILSTVPLVVFVARPALAPALLLLVVSGVMWSYQVPLQSAFVAQIPGEFRGRAFGVAAAGLQVAQGIGVLAAGVLAQVFGAAEAITIGGVAGCLGMLALLATRTAALTPPLPSAVAVASPLG